MCGTNDTLHTKQIYLFVCNNETILHIMALSATIVTSLNKAYNLLPDNKKFLVYAKHGCSESQFRKILKGDVKDPQEYTKALGSIKKVSGEELQNQTKNHTEIVRIVTDELQNTVAVNT